MEAVVIYRSKNCQLHLCCFEAVCGVHNLARKCTRLRYVYDVIIIRAKHLKRLVLYVRHLPGRRQCAVAVLDRGRVAAIGPVLDET